MNMEELEPKSVRVLQLGKDDVLVYRSNGFLSKEAIAGITAQLKAEFPDNRALILNHGDDLLVVRSDAASEEE